MSRRSPRRDRDAVAASAQIDSSSSSSTPFKQEDPDTSHTSSQPQYHSSTTMPEAAATPAIKQPSQSPQKSKPEEPTSNNSSSSSENTQQSQSNQQNQSPTGPTTEDVASVQTPIPVSNVRSRSITPPPPLQFKQEAQSQYHQHHNNNNNNHHQHSHQQTPTSAHKQIQSQSHHHQQQFDTPQPQVHDSPRQTLSPPSAFHNRTNSTPSSNEQRSRKDSHKEVERRRREAINDGINALRKIVPGCEKNKGSILNSAVAYIHQLKEGEANNIEKWTLEKLLSDQEKNELNVEINDLKQLLYERDDMIAHLTNEIHSLRHQLGRQSPYETRLPSALEQTSSTSTPRNEQILTKREEDAHDRKHHLSDHQDPSSNSNVKRLRT